jgi:hypothetical protein
MNISNSIVGSQIIFMTRVQSGNTAFKSLKVEISSTNTRDIYEYEETCGYWGVKYGPGKIWNLLCSVFKYTPRHQQTYFVLPLFCILSSK